MSSHCWIQTHENKPVILPSLSFMRFSTAWTSICSITGITRSKLSEKAKQMEIHGNAAGQIQTGWPAGSALSQRRSVVKSGYIALNIHLAVCMTTFFLSEQKLSIHFLICWLSCDVVIFQKIVIIIYVNQPGGPRNLMKNPMKNAIHSIKN